MYFDQNEDREGHGHHSLPPAPSEEQEIKNTCILTSTRMERVTATTLFHLHQVKSRRWKTHVFWPLLGWRGSRPPLSSTCTKWRAGDEKHMYFDQHEDGVGHGHQSLTPAPSEEQEMKNKCIFYQCCGSGMFIPDRGSGFFHLWPRSTTHWALGIWSEMFIPDPDSFHSGSRIQGSKKPWIPDPRSVTLLLFYKPILVYVALSCP